VAAVHGPDPNRWWDGFDGLLARVAGWFAREEPRCRARAFVVGLLLADLPRKNCWAFAEHAGDSSPDGMQHLLGKAAWDADVVRDDVRRIAVEHLGTVDAIVVVDETGDVKKGEHTVGVQQEYTVPLGRSRTPRSARFSPIPDPVLDLAASGPPGAFLSCHLSMRWRTASPSRVNAG
jgi:SRSO17 transposase